MEDIIFSSIYSTFYEHLFITIHENDHLTLELIDKFSENGKEREYLIASQTQLHFNYILNGGQCDGCDACENHDDVRELLDYYREGDLSFFVNLYIGMQTISFALEQLLYDILPSRPDLTPNLTAENILEYRKFMVDYSDNKLKDL